MYTHQVSKALRQILKNTDEFPPDWAIDRSGESFVMYLGLLKAHKQAMLATDWHGEAMAYVSVSQKVIIIRRATLWPLKRCLAYVKYYTREQT